MVAAAQETTPAVTVAWSSDPGAWGDEWRALEQLGMTSVYQTAAFARAWYATIAPHDNALPLIVLVRIDGRPAALLPLSLERVGPAKVARFAGSSHSNHNLGALDPDLSGAIDSDGWRAVLREVATGAGVDAFEFRRVPVTWECKANPVAAALPATPSPTISQITRVEGSFEALLARHNGASKRKKAKTKERILNEAGDYRVAIAQTCDEVEAAIEAFFRQKAERLAGQGIRDPFSEPGCRGFFEALAKPGQHPAALELAYLTAGGQIRAVFGLGVHAGRASLMVLSYAQDELTKASPGETLLFRLMEILCRRELRLIDYGVGRERYKDSWADVEEPLADCRLAITALGRLYVASRDIRDGLERAVRNSPRAWAFYRRLRSLRGRRAGLTPPEAGAGER